MNKIQLFSEKAAYAAPSSKLIVLQGRQSLMSSSLNGGEDSLEKMKIIGGSGFEWDEEE